MFKDAERNKEYFRNYNKTPKRIQYMKDYRERLKGNVRIHDDKYKWNRRTGILEVVANGGPIECVRCGINDKRCLSIHHTNGDGERDIKLYQKLHTNKDMLRDAVQKGEIELRCWNCNIIAEYETFKRRYSRALYWDEDSNPVWDDCEKTLIRSNHVTSLPCTNCGKLFEAVSRKSDKKRVNQNRYCSVDCFRQYRAEHKKMKEL